MSLQLDDGGPAFPRVRKVRYDLASDGSVEENLTGGGASLLDYFAAHAISALLEMGSERVRDIKAGRKGENDIYWPDQPYYFEESLTEKSASYPGSVTGAESLAIDAYTIAEAMVAEKRRRESQ